VIKKEKTKFKLIYLRIIFLFIAVIFITSCDKFSFAKNKNIQSLDTIVDFGSVDTYPSFKVCDSLIDKEQKYDCFRNTIHIKIGEELKKHNLTAKDSINETVLTNLIINSNGNFILDDLTISNRLKTQLPKLDSLIKVSVSSLPKIYPAIKRGIPVTTKYQLPIKIVLK
jgi:hypothetical protein